jgi:hypothetical protein
MSTMTELTDQGCRMMRLPGWNEHAYAAPRRSGPWADIYDAGAGPVPVLIAECDEDNRWEPVPAVGTT